MGYGLSNVTSCGDLRANSTDCGEPVRKFQLDVVATQKQFSRYILCLDEERTHDGETSKQKINYCREKIVRNIHPPRSAAIARQFVEPAATLGRVSG